MPSDQQFAFPPFRLDPVKEQLWCEDQPIPLRPKLFAILRHLVANAGRLIPREELLTAVWPGTMVSEGVLRGCIRALREVLDDDPETPRFIETVTRRGYRFISPVASQDAVASSPAAPTIPHLHSPPLSFVGREEELEQLQRVLERARRGERQVVFVTGESGMGKTTVVGAFLQRLNMSEALWLGQGQCVEHYGSSEAYLPVLEALGSIGQAPGGERFVALLSQHAPTWLVQMPALLSVAVLEVLQRTTAGATRERMLREMVEAIDALTAERLLVLWLEDLHWADYSTIDWLAAVAQRRRPARLLVIGTYRPAEVSLSSHPLKAVKRELQARGQCEEVWVQFLTPEQIVQYLTLRYPRHQFPAALGYAIHRNTDGNPLFVVNLVDDLVARGVISESEGQWRLRVSVEEVAWGVPESLRQLIEQQVERLSEEQQRLLEVASVAGSEFSAATVAAGLETTAEQVEEVCEGLVHRGQFLQSQGPHVLPDGTMAGRYRFLHALYQTVLYERLPTVRRMRLHQRVGTVLEERYGPRAPEIAAELALHFEQGQDPQRAVHYFQQAAERVLRRYAHREAVVCQRRALTALQSLPDTLERARQELVLQVALGISLSVTDGFAVPEVERAYARARTLCQQIGDAPALVPILYGLWNFYITRADFQSASALAAQMLSLAETAQEPAFLLAAHNAQMQTLVEQGALLSARAHMERVLGLYDPEKHHVLVEVYGEDFGVSCRVLAIVLMWQLGYPEQALHHAQAVREIAERVSHPLSLAQALYFGAMLHVYLRDSPSVQQLVGVLLPLCREHGLSFWLAGGQVLQGWASVQAGQTEDGITAIRQGIADWRAIGAQIWLPILRSMLVEAYACARQPVEGLAVVEEALAGTRTTGEVFFDAELYRLRGELMLQSQTGPRPVQGKSRAGQRKSQAPNT